MKTIAALAAGICLAFAAQAPAAQTSPARDENISFRNEIQHAIDRGLEWLSANQNSNGWWQTPNLPAVTALAVTAFNGDPMDRYRNKSIPHLARAYEFILRSARPDGGIYVTNYAAYNTSVSMMAFLTARDSRYDDTLRKARAFLVGVQRDFGEKGKLDTPFDGGFGYGLPTDKVSDLSNTILALEALHYSRRLVQDTPGAPDLNWNAAIHFLQSCQNLPSHNQQPWVSDDPKDKGGFIYNSGRSNAGGVTNAATGKVSLRSYASISYAGLLSYIYADVKKDDPRVSAVMEWLKDNYTLEENPGMGQAGLFYYYHTMTKALTAAGVSAMPGKDGKMADWRQDLAMKLIQLQQRDGSWANENARWMEKEPALVTSYALLSLEMLWRQLGG